MLVTNSEDENMRKIIYVRHTNIRWRLAVALARSNAASWRWYLRKVYYGLLNNRFNTVIKKNTVKRFGLVIESHILVDFGCMIFACERIA